MQDEEYRGVDERLLDDFQRELDAEKKSRKERMVKIGVGLVLGLLVAAGFAWYSGFGAGGADATVTPEVTEANVPMNVDDLVSPRTVGDDDALSQLAGENEIEQDIAPPGSLMEKGSETAIVPSSGKSPPEPEAFLITPSPTGFFFGRYLLSGLPDTPSFTVRIKAFDDAEKANAERDRLRERGIDAWIDARRGERRRYAVDVGSFRSAEEAARQAGPLRHHGYLNEVILLEDGGMFTLRVGSFTKKSDATDTANRVSGSGFPATVHISDEPITFQLVQVGRFTTKEEAKAEAARLRGLGIPSLGISLVTQ